MVKRDPSKFKSAVRFRYPAPKFLKMENNKTYQNDSSFFGYVNIAGNLEICGTAILEWFQTEPHAQFRLIVDNEIHEEFSPFSTIQDIYPGIITVAWVANPWRRLVNIFEIMQTLYQTKQKLNITKNINFENFTFDSFLKQLDADVDQWFLLSTPQSRWLDNPNEFLHIIRDEFIEEDMKPIQDYFQSDKLVSLTLLPYREYYTEETKKFVEDLFKEDIERFNFKF
jgi:hypothetical protein